MGRPQRFDQRGYAYHVLNRANSRLQMFEKAGDYTALERVLYEARIRFDTRILAFCIMPNHWHLVLWTRHDSELSKFVGWLTLTHTQRWHAHRDNVGEGHLYQGRYKSFPVTADEHLYSVIRYVERNPLRAGLVPRAESWRWSSLWYRSSRNPKAHLLLSDWPLTLPDDWTLFVNGVETDAELLALRKASQRGTLYGDAKWKPKALDIVSEDV